MTDLTAAADIQSTVARALAEDLGDIGDVTAALIPAEQTASATILLRETAIIAGRPWFDEAFRQIDDSLEIQWHCDEGSEQVADTVICTLSGNARNLLTGERTALNFLQTLSGTATTTSYYAKALDNSGTRILDTRKTLPGLRMAQKYAVKCGGGKNHRIGLFDQFLIKENHIMAAGSITKAVNTARKLHPQLKIEVETENLEEFDEALTTDAHIIMLDNYDIDSMKEAVRRNQGRKRLEVSGNVTLEQLPKIAATGVNFISSGALTKDVKSIDFSMRFKNTNA